MRASFPAADVPRLLRQIEVSPGWQRVRALDAAKGAATPDTCEMVLDAADRFGREILAPLNDAMDLEGCTLVGGRVRTAPGHRQAWDAFVAAGWPTLDVAEAHGGQALPTLIAFAAQELFDRACPAFGMLPVPQRSALRLIAAYGDDGVKAEWLARLASGEWGATICVSEPEAGSDLTRIQARAINVDGAWRVTGEKCWISFGDHDLTDRIGHIVLAKTVDAAWAARPSLFLVPSTLADGTGNAIAVRRIEDKLGLHGSPTCGLGFEGATGVLLGEAGRGLAQMFVMIANMRLAVGAMGLGIASACADLALAYARDRRQGGHPVPVPIAEHPDVQRMLLDMTADADLLRGLLYAVANLGDLAAAGDAPAALLAGWLLPIVKTLGGETSFATASTAIQVLGGAGYTREWPAEQALRDARVLTVFEGTTGIQALDLVRRRLLASAGAAPFLAAARAVAEARLGVGLDALERAAAWLSDHPEGVDAGATAFLHLAMLTARGWIAAGYLGLEGDDPQTLHLRAVAGHFLDALPRRAAALAAGVMGGHGLVERFAAINRP